ncbi:MAG: glycosyltransferase family 4 protein [Candidatus Gracilibacteria bacterium]|jgi:glycosyltransferase involved in cell wall biosynthesis
MIKIPNRRVLVTRFPFESQFGGEELHTLAVCEGLYERGVFCAFLGSCPVLLRAMRERHFDSKHAWLSRPPVTKARLFLFTLMSPLLFLLSGFYLWRARAAWQVDTVYMLGFSEKLLMTPWALVFGIKVLWLEHARIGRWFTANPWRRVYTFLSKWVTVVVTSNAMKPVMAKYARRVVAISCGVVQASASTLPTDLREFMQGGFVIGSVARLSIDKGVDMLVHLVHSKPDTKLVLVGQGPLKSSLLARARAGKFDNRIFITTLKTRGEMMAFYSAINLFVLPAREFDPFGMAAAEAMWNGTPVVVTDKCGIAFDLVGADAAVICAPTVAGIDKSIKFLRRHPAEMQAMAARGQALARKKYRLEEMVKRFWEVIG